MVYTLAVDIGGTKIATGIMKNNNVWVSEYIQQSDVTTSESMYESLVSSMYNVLKKANLMKEQINNYCIAIPGQVDYKKGIAIYQNNLPWRNFQLGELLQKEFLNKDIIFEHDVVASALGEYAIRNQSYDIFVYVTISTGISASILYNGKPMRGDGMAGEIGFFPVRSNNTLENFASGSAMEKELMENYNGISLNLAMDKWKKGDKLLIEFFDGKAHQIAMAIFYLTAMLDPNKIVLGGGVINNQVEFYELIKKHYHDLCNHPIQKDWILKVESSILKGKSGLFGAATRAR